MGHWRKREKAHGQSSTRSLLTNQRSLWPPPPSLSEQVSNTFRLFGRVRTNGKPGQSGTFFLSFLFLSFPFPALCLPLFPRGAGGPQRNQPSFLLKTTKESSASSLARVTTRNSFSRSNVGNVKPNAANVTRGRLASPDAPVLCVVKIMPSSSFRLFQAFPNLSLSLSPPRAAFFP